MTQSRLSLRDKITRVSIYFALFVAFFVVVFPLFWIIATSLKSIPETYQWPPTLFPKSPTFEAYIGLWKIKNFSTYFKNSLIVAVASTLASVALASLAGYGFSRFNFKGKDTLLFLFLFTQMIPAILLLLPYFIVMRSLDLINTHLALILAYTSFALPFCTWMLKGFFDSIPQDIDESAMIDGCSRIQSLWHVIMPLALPGFAATALFSFLVAWNHYLFGLGLTTTPDMYTLPVGISSTMGEFRIEWNELMAGAAIASVPTIIVYSFLERYFVEGLTAGAVKG